MLVCARMCVCVLLLYVCTISKQKLFSVNTALLPLVLDTIEHIRLFLSLYTNTHLLQSPIHIYTPANPPIHTHSFYKYMDIHTSIQYTLTHMYILLSPITNLSKPVQNPLHTCTDSQNAPVYLSMPLQTCGIPCIFPTSSLHTRSLLVFTPVLPVHLFTCPSSLLCQFCLFLCYLMVNLFVFVRFVLGKYVTLGRNLN